MSRKVKKESLYNGLREDGKPWPDVLIGIRDIACYMRMHPATISRWVREGRLESRNLTDRNRTVTPVALFGRPLNSGPIRGRMGAPANTHRDARLP